VPSCIFDGRSPTTNAHIFREGWIRDLTPEVEVLRHVHTRHEPGSEFEKEWRTERASFKVNCACGRCNAGWMNDLDLAAEDMFVTAAAKGRSAKLLRPSDKRTVARWCVLVATLFDQGQAQPRLDRTFHEAFYGGAIPEGVGVWLSSVVPDDKAPVAFAFVKDLISEDEDGTDLLPPAYFATFGVRHLVAQVMIPFSSAPTSIRVRRHTSGGILGSGGILRALWPDPLTPLVWPPPEQLDWADMDEFTRSFQTFESLS
jgi:hypothetical protein